MEIRTATPADAESMARRRSWARRANSRRGNLRMATRQVTAGVAATRCCLSDQLLVLRSRIRFESDRMTSIAKVGVSWTRKRNSW